jgi:MFS family permease
MGIQHTFGGVPRVLFPVAAGLLMDHFGLGVPFWISALLVLATLPFAWALADSLPPESPATVAVRMVSSADVTGEFPAEKWLSRGCLRAIRWGAEVPHDQIQ